MTFQPFTRVAAAALALASAAASAGTLQIGEITKGQKTFVDTGAFTDVYQFNLAFPPPAEVGFSLIELKFKQFTDINFGTVAFYNNYNFNTMTGVGPIGPSPMPLFPVPFGGADAISISGLLVNQSPFYLEVKGTAVGTGLLNKGSYSFEIEAAPVPEPSAGWLLLGGLGLVGAMLRRRAPAASSVQCAGA